MLGAEHVHQGVVNNVTDHGYLILDDEFAEHDATVGPMTQGLPTTHIFDIRELENPFYSGKVCRQDPVKRPQSIRQRRLPLPSQLE